MTPLPETVGTVGQTVETPADSLSRRLSDCRDLPYMKASDRQSPHIGAEDCRIDCRHRKTVGRLRRPLTIFRAQLILIKERPTRIAELSSPYRTPTPGSLGCQQQEALRSLTESSRLEPRFTACSRRVCATPCFARRRSDAPCSQ